MLSLSNLKPAYGSRTHSKRVGRGNASGKGTTAGRGTKGQKARSGGRKGLKRLGMRRMLLGFPKIGGFRSPYPRSAVLNVRDLDHQFTSGAFISPRVLVKRGLVSKIDGGVKILGEGQITKKFIIKDCQVSERARQKIIDAGGEVK
jgi:large subunit ribosomal protein L15